MSKSLSISLFCGGRGSATIIRELLRRPQVELNLLVNAYDDGLSTGTLRNLIPGMLGPSDFRKNLSYVMELYSREQFSLLKLLEHRFSSNFSTEHFKQLISTLDTSSPKTSLSDLLGEDFVELDFPYSEKFNEYLSIFYNYCTNNKIQFDFTDCSLGNLLFCGTYLKNDCNFNQATNELAKLFGSKANLINVTSGENRVLAGLKQNGELLSTEAQIVGKHNSLDRILEIFLLSKPLTDKQIKQIEEMSLEDKRKFLLQLEAKVRISDEARNALINSDIIIYGPGTQHSSLFPSYKTIGIPEAIQESQAKVKAFIVNLRRDHDIESLDATDIIDLALGYLKDNDNFSNIITHILYNKNSNLLSDGIHYEKDKISEKQIYKNSIWIEGDFEHELKSGVHSGVKIIDTILPLLEYISIQRKPVLDIYIDLNQRSLATNQLIQEFIELSWQKYFSHIRLYINQSNIQQIILPDYLEIKATQYKSSFSEIEIFLNWLSNEKSQFLVTITGDGEYRLRDIFLAIEVLKNHDFGAVYGSRTQSRRQVIQSLDSAYSESKIFYTISWLGGFLLTAIWSIRFKVIFSDPLTGFRIYKRDNLVKKLKYTRSILKCQTPSGITKIMLKRLIEIAEFPVYYKTFKGFTNIKFRLFRGLKNAWETLF